MVRIVHSFALLSLMFICTCCTKIPNGNIDANHSEKKEIITAQNNNNYFNTQHIKLLDTHSAMHYFIGNSIEENRNKKFRTDIDKIDREISAQEEANRMKTNHFYTPNNSYTYYKLPKNGEIEVIRRSDIESNGRLDVKFKLFE